MIRSSFILLIFLFFACNPKTTGPAPVDVDRLAALLKDMHLANGLSIEIAVNIRDSMRQEMEMQIIEDHGYTLAEFDSLMWVVRSEPEWVEEVFRKVSDDMATFEAENSRIPEQVEN